MMALEQPIATPLTVSQEPRSTEPGARALVPGTGDLLTPAALAALAIHAPGVPTELWQRALIGPVQELLIRPGKGFRARLSEIAYRLAGGRGTPPAALANLLEVVHAGSMIIDDIEDGSRRRRGGPAVHHVHGMPLALNAGNWMYFAPFSLLDDLDLRAGAQLHLLRRMARVLLDCHFGQALDLGARLHELRPHEIEDVAATITTLKTGRLLGLAAEAGAVVAGAPPELVAAMASFGEELGVGLQMLDDLGNLSGHASADKRYEDLRSGRVTWVWAWAARQLPSAELAQLIDERARLARLARLDMPEDERRSASRWLPLATRLRAAVLAHGRLTVHWHLSGALARLREAVGDHAGLAALAEEIARLEVSYG
jgi:geranylgeranyl pyrophosphate synthase